MSLIKLAAKNKKDYKRGALIGGSFGGLVGGIGSIAAFAHKNPNPANLGRALTLGVGGGALLGTGAGALIGKKDNQ